MNAKEHPDYVNEQEKLAVCRRASNMNIRH